MKKILALLLVTILFIGCTPKAEDLTKNYKSRIEKVTGTPSEVFKATQMEFGVEILKQSYKNENILVSPLSIELALAMVFNGADNETKTQMESVFGLSPEDLNVELNKYVSNLPSNKSASLHIANSIWLKDEKDFTVKEDFLQTNADYYDSGVFKEPFDGETVKKINSWVDDNTHGMIEKIIDRIDDPLTVMYLINALAFEAKWIEPYEKTDVSDGTFTTISGEKQTVKMMASTEYTYLEDENATGFIKRYEGGNYAFATLLPKGDIESYVNLLSGENLINVFENKTGEKVICKMPKFNVDYGVTLNDILISMGMPDAFDVDKADFSKISDAPLYINRVLHKTHITVDELGTKAGAVTAVEKNCGSAMIDKPKEVILDRPFVYMIIDTTTNLPIFMGVLTEIK